MSMSFHAKVIGQKLRGSFCEQPNGPEDSLNEHKLHGKFSALLTPDSYKRMIIMKMCLARLEIFGPKMTRNIVTMKSLH